MAIKLDRRNYRKHDDKNKNLIKKSLEECGAGRSIVVDAEDEIIAGNGVFEQAQKLNIPVKVVETDGSELVVVKRTDLKSDDERRKRLAVMDNSTSDNSEFDLVMLSEDFALDDLAVMGIEMPNLEGNIYTDITSGSLKDKYLTNPFSVLKSSTWQDRKRQWLALGIKSELGRSDNFYSGLYWLAKRVGQSDENAKKAGTSIFDPVLCELMYSWFSKKGDKVVDPFAGGSVRGIVASVLGRDYLGIDLRKEQISANIENAREVCSSFMPCYKEGDSNVVLDSLPDDEYDMCLSCPPYIDLEVYSDNPQDLSNMEYDDFIMTYSSIIKKLFGKMKDDSFVVWVVGEVRKKDGNYYNFIGNTIQCFLNAGFNYYNEIILETMLGTAALRAQSIFGVSRKIIKVHQNVLVFVKGNGKVAARKIGNVEIKKINKEDLDKTD